MKVDSGFSKQTSAGAGTEARACGFIRRSTDGDGGLNVPDKQQRKRMPTLNCPDENQSRAKPDDRDGSLQAEQPVRGLEKAQ